MGGFFWTSLFCLAIIQFAAFSEARWRHRRLQIQDERPISYDLGRVSKSQSKGLEKHINRLQHTIKLVSKTPNIILHRLSDAVERLEAVVSPMYRSLAAPSFLPQFSRRSAATNHSTSVSVSGIDDKKYLKSKRMKLMTKPNSINQGQIGRKIKEKFVKKTKYNNSKRKGVKPEKNKKKGISKNENKNVPNKFVNKQLIHKKKPWYSGKINKKNKYLWKNSKHNKHHGRGAAAKISKWHKKSKGRKNKLKHGKRKAKRQDYTDGEKPSYEESSEEEEGTEEGGTAAEGRTAVAVSAGEGASVTVSASRRLLNDVKQKYWPKVYREEYQKYLKQKNHLRNLSKIMDKKLKEKNEKETKDKSNRRSRDRRNRRKKKDDEKKGSASAAVSASDDGGVSVSVSASRRNNH